MRRRLSVSVAEKIWRIATSSDTTVRMMPASSATRAGVATASQPAQSQVGGRSVIPIVDRYDCFVIPQTPGHVAPIRPTPTNPILESDCLITLPLRSVSMRLIAECSIPQ